MLKAYQNKLDILIKEIEDEGYDIRAAWADEYGGEQSIIENVRFIVEKKKQEIDHSVIDELEAREIIEWRGHN